MSSFVVIVLSSLSIFLVFLLSSVPSGLFPWVILFVLLLELGFSFCLYMFQRSSILSFLLVAVDFLSAFPVEFPTQVLLLLSLSLLLFEFFILASADGFSLEFEWQHVSSILSILADLNNPVVWVVSTHPLISKSPSPCTNPLVTVPGARITIGIVVVSYTFPG